MGADEVTHTPRVALPNYVFVLAPIEPDESWAYACSACDATRRGFIVEAAAADSAAMHAKEMHSADR